MKKINETLKKMENNPTNIGFIDLFKVCEFYFGKPRNKGTSHCIFRTPWQGDPRINIQNAKSKAKAYQVKQVLLAIRKLEDKPHG